MQRTEIEAADGTQAVLAADTRFPTSPTADVEDLVQHYQCHKIRPYHQTLPVIVPACRSLFQEAQWQAVAEASTKASASTCSEPDSPPSLECDSKTEGCHWPNTWSSVLEFDASWARDAKAKSDGVCGDADAWPLPTSELEGVHLAHGAQVEALGNAVEAVSVGSSPMFQQPPGSELETTAVMQRLLQRNQDLETAAVMQRLLQRNKELEELLARSGVAEHGC